MTPFLPSVLRGDGTKGSAFPKGSYHVIRGEIWPGDDKKKCGENRSEGERGTSTLPPTMKTISIREENIRDFSSPLEKVLGLPGVGARDLSSLE